MSFAAASDQAHLNGSERLLQLSVAAVALIGQELCLWPPIDEVGLPVVFAPAGKAESFEAHGFQRDISGQDHQVGPGNLPAILLLDRPEQSPRLVEAGIVRPAVERLEALLTAAGAAAPVTHAVRARAVPSHPDEERPIVAVVCRPPVLRRLHQRLDVLLHGVEVEARKLLGVVELIAKWIGLSTMLPQRREVQLFRPPILV
jgi:hypothetical protein